MKNIFISFCCLSIVCTATGQTVQMVRDSENIQALLESMSKAWNTHDAGAYCMAFSEEADFTNTFGVNTYGRDSIQKDHEKSFATVFKNSSLKITGKKIRYITNDILAVDVWWEMMGSKASDGKDMPLRKGLANLLMTRNGEQWLILIMHDMKLPGS
ncbi:MAG: SgcJ/EcaC family oxidoreductase [Puia sp.]